MLSGFADSDSSRQIRFGVLAFGGATLRRKLANDLLLVSGLLKALRDIRPFWIHTGMPSGLFELCRL